MRKRVRRIVLAGIAAATFLASPRMVAATPGEECIAVCYLLYGACMTQNPEMWEVCALGLTGCLYNCPQPE